MTAFGKVGQRGGAGQVEAQGGPSDRCQSVRLLRLQGRLRLVHPGGGPLGFAQPGPQPPQPYQVADFVLVHQPLQLVQLRTQAGCRLQIGNPLVGQISRISGQLSGLP